MAKFKYKNISKQTVFVPNVGSAEPGELLDSEVKINSPYLEEASSNESKKKVKK